MTFSRHYKICSVALAFVLTAPGAEARFLETDASQIDQEERYNTETYNDKYSYRFPVGWSQLYDNSDAALRIHAGSLNASRFDYTEEIKFHADNSAAAFTFFQTRKEDVLEQRTSREARVSGIFPYGIYLSLVGDGGTFKEYGDIGGAIGIGDIRKPWVELLYWSVDHFYATKKSDPDDRRPKNTSTLAFKSNFSTGTAHLVAVRGEYDQPLVWQRPSLGYDYEYQATSVSANYRWQYDPQRAVTVNLDRSTKREGKTWLDIDYGKRLEREVRLTELQWIDAQEHIQHSLGVAYLDRRAHYEHFGSAMNNPDSLPEIESPKNSKRDETVAFASRMFPLSADRHYMQYGIHLNQVNLKETRHDRVTESKGQVAWEYRYNKATRVFLNTSWDVNQLTDDFPFDKRPFRPWGGGDIQFIAAF